MLTCNLFPSGPEDDFILKRGSLRVVVDYLFYFFTTIHDHTSKFPFFIIKLLDPFVFISIAERLYLL